MPQKVYAKLGHPKMHPHTKFGIPTSKNIEVMQILETRSEFKVTVTGKWNGKSAILRCIHTPNLGFLPQMIKEICSIYYYSKNQVKGQVYSDPNMVRNTPPSQDSYTYQIWNSYHKEYIEICYGHNNS